MVSIRIYNEIIKRLTIFEHFATLQSFYNHTWCLTADFLPTHKIYVKILLLLLFLLPRFCWKKMKRLKLFIGLAFHTIFGYFLKCLNLFNYHNIMPAYTFYHSSLPFSKPKTWNLFLCFYLISLMASRRKIINFRKFLCSEKLPKLTTHVHSLFQPAFHVKVFNEVDESTDYQKAIINCCQNHATKKKHKLSTHLKSYLKFQKRKKEMSKHDD